MNVNEQAILSSEDSTPEDRIQTQLDQTNRYANKLAATVARAIRLQANGQEVDAGQVREQARAIYEQLLEPIQAAPAGRDLLTFSPLDLMAEYWQQQA